jgi:hypothetical protein
MRGRCSSSTPDRPTRRPPGGAIRATLGALAASIAAGAVLGSSPAQARCECRCVEGEVVALCDQPGELPPLCPPRICPIVPPRLQPVVPPNLPPPGRERCELRRVLDPATGRYEWQEVCN